MTPDFEFYETAQTFTRYLFLEMKALGHSIHGNVFEPCVGSNAIPRAYASLEGDGRLCPPWTVDQWMTNDLDPRWGNATQHMDATKSECWAGLAKPIDFTVSNPAFTPAIEIVDNALAFSRVGVAMHLRASIHEVLKTGIRRTFMAEQTPTGILWLPRFAYQRSRTKGIWSTDSVCACWVIWLQDRSIPQFIRYAHEWVLDELEQETPEYRQRMDLLAGYTGTEAERQEQCKAAWREAA